MNSCLEHAWLMLCQQFFVVLNSQLDEILKKSPKLRQQMGRSK
jgi:hypothetical protein